MGNSMNRVGFACVLGWVAVSICCGSEGEADRVEVEEAELPPAIAAQVARAPDRAAQVRTVEAWKARKGEVAAFLERAQA